MPSPLGQDAVTRSQINLSYKIAVGIKKRKRVLNKVVYLHFGVLGVIFWIFYLHMKNADLLIF